MRERSCPVCSRYATYDVGAAAQSTAGGCCSYGSRTPRRCLWPPMMCSRVLNWRTMWPEPLPLD